MCKRKKRFVDALTWVEKGLAIGDDRRRGNQPLATAYYMKERLRLLFQCIDKDRAKAELSSWIEQARTSGIRILKSEPFIFILSYFVILSMFF